MADKAYFSRDTLQFLSDLKANNYREWFNENKPRYEKNVKQAFLYFISDFAPHLEMISKQFRADPRPNGGSLFRIYRDIRFSKNKDPYKTHAGAQFRHELGKDYTAPGFYLHVESENVIAAAGVWHPEGKALRKIREFIDDNQERWIKVKSDPDFADNFTFEGDSLKRNPVGFDKDHPLIEDLKRKDFAVVFRYNDDEIFMEDFLDKYVDFCKKTSAFVKFLCDALEMPF